MPIIETSFANFGQWYSLRLANFGTRVIALGPRGHVHLKEVETEIVLEHHFRTLLETINSGGSMIFAPHSFHVRGEARPSGLRSRS
jgi:hypothetical protein